MKLNDLIVRLVELEKKHGPDIIVRVPENSNWLNFVTHVEYIESVHGEEFIDIVTDEWRLKAEQQQ